jgi:UDP-glucuronate 4-epimerase
MKVLITGCCGFIGFNFSKFLLEKNKNIKIYGLDNLNNYYSVDLKKKRLMQLKKYKNFKFYYGDITNKKLLEKVFKDRFDSVFHLAAQAGVRYSIINPTTYIHNNIVGFFNILNICKIKKINKFFYASSSSVYGDNKLYPLKENFSLSPKNMYGLTKKINEDIIHVFASNSLFRAIGLRFFTVYGEWGRPDMFITKYLIAKNKKKGIFYLNNFGNHYRDFTYIKDVCAIMYLLLKKRIKKKHQVFNVCSNKPVKITNIISMIDALFNFRGNSRIIKRKFQSADVIKTHGDNKLIKKFSGYKKFTDISIGIKNTVEWFIKYKKKIKF